MTVARWCRRASCVLFFVIAIAVLQAPRYGAAESAANESFRPASEVAVPASQAAALVGSEDGPLSPQTLAIRAALDPWLDAEDPCIRVLVRRSAFPWAEAVPGDAPGARSTNVEPSFTRISFDIFHLNRIDPQVAQMMVRCAEQRRSADNDRGVAETQGDDWDPAVRAEPIAAALLRAFDPPAGSSLRVVSLPWDELEAGAPTREYIRYRGATFSVRLHGSDIGSVQVTFTRSGQLARVVGVYTGLSSDVLSLLQRRDLGPDMAREIAREAAAADWNARRERQSDPTSDPVFDIDAACVQRSLGFQEPYVIYQVEGWGYNIAIDVTTGEVIAITYQADLRDERSVSTCEPER